MVMNEKIKNEIKTIFDDFGKVYSIMETAK